LTGSYLFFAFDTHGAKVKETFGFFVVLTKVIRSTGIIHRLFWLFGAIPFYSDNKPLFL
jgi:hypothetical protein